MTARTDPLDPHHDGSARYTGDADGARRLGDTVDLCVRVPHAADGSPGAAEVVVRSVRDGEPLIRRASRDSVDEAGAWWTRAGRAGQPGDVVPLPGLARARRTTAG